MRAQEGGSVPQGTSAPSCHHSALKRVAPGNVRVTPWHRPTLCSLLSRRSPPRPAALGSSTGQRPPPATAPDMRVLDPRPPPALQLQGRPGSWASSSRGSPDGRHGRQGLPLSHLLAAMGRSLSFRKLVSLSSNFLQQRKEGDAGSPTWETAGLPVPRPPPASLTHVNEKHPRCFRLIWFPAKTN